MGIVWRKHTPGGGDPRRSRRGARRGSRRDGLSDGQTLGVALDVLHPPGIPLEQIPRVGEVEDRRHHQILAVTKKDRGEPVAPRDLLLALVVIVAWGVNFVVIKVGLHGVPPMLLGGLRFTLAAFPAVFFVKRPNVPLKWLLAYGFSISLGQFSLLFYAMSVGMPAGLASLVLQAQAFFTLIFAAVLLGERFRAPNFVGLVIAACGLAIIGMQGGHAVPVAGFALTLAASAMWALGNAVTKAMGKVDLVSLVVWGSLIPPVPFFLLSWLLEGPERIQASLAGISLVSVGAIAYLAFVATLIGYSIWGKLLSRYPAAQVAPFSLLVPVFGLGSAAVFLGEGMDSAQLAGAVLVMAGLLVNVFGAWIWGRVFVRPAG
jgi:O-acetylserine/cysteine efflux transporter